MGERAPPALKWLLGQLCAINLVPELCITISKSNLEVLATTILNRDDAEDTCQVSKQVVAFLNSSDAELFRTPGPQTIADYVVNVVPVLLGVCGMDLSVEAWNDAVADLQGRLLASEIHRDQEYEGNVSDQFLGDRPVLSPAMVFSSAENSWQGIGGEEEGPLNPQVFAEQVVPWFEKLSKQQLLDKLHARDVELSQLRAQADHLELEREADRKHISGLKLRLKRSQRECKGLTAKTSKLLTREQKLKEQVEKLKTMLIERRGNRCKNKGDAGDSGERGWLTPSGIVQLAIKRNLAHCASEHLQMVIMQDISRWTVSRCSAM